MVANSDHITPVTGITPTVTLSKNGAAFGAAAGAVTEVANGVYCVAGNATDTNTLGPLWLHATGTGADATDRGDFDVVAFDPQSATSLGLSNLDAAITSRMATYTQPTGFLAATFPGGTIASTTNLTAGTISTVTNNVGGVVGNVGGDISGNVLGNVNGNVAGTVGSVIGTIGSISTAGLALLWQDAVAAHFTTNNSIGKALYIAAAPGAAGGHYIAGSNAAITEASHAITGNSTVGGDMTVTGTLSASILSCLTVFNAPGTVNLGSGVGGVVNVGAVTATDAGNDIRLGATERTNIGTATDTVLSGTHGAGAWGSGATGGSNAITIKITSDGVTAIQGALVSLRNGAVLLDYGATNSSGNTTGFSANNGTFALTVVAAGYANYSANITVTTPATFTVTMTANVAPSPTSPNKATITGTLLDGSGNAVVNAIGTITLHVGAGKWNPVVSGGNIVSKTPVTFTTNASGLIKASDGTTTLQLIRTDSMTIPPAGADALAYWLIEWDSAGLKVARKFFLAAASFDISTIAAP